MMRLSRSIAIIAASLAALSATPRLAPAQTVMNLTNFDITGATTGSTSLDLTNTAVAFSSGGLFAGAFSNQAQRATNQLNVLDMLGTAGTIVPFNGGGMVTINMVAGATSLTTNNLGAAIMGGINPIIGSTILNTPWSGGYGPSFGGAFLGGSQIGVNNTNSVAMSVAPGTQVTLNQGGVSLGLLPVAPTGTLNSSSVNTLIASGSAATVNGALTGGQPGVQMAGSTINSGTIVGSGNVTVQQTGIDTATIQAVNRTGAFGTPTLLPVPVLR